MLAKSNSTLSKRPPLNTRREGNVQAVGAEGRAGPVPVYTGRGLLELGQEDTGEVARRGRAEPWPAESGQCRAQRAPSAPPLPLPRPLPSPPLPAPGLLGFRHPRPARPRQGGAGKAEPAAAEAPAPSQLRVVGPSSRLIQNPQAELGI
ncbi:Centrosomal Protein Poc5 [Manis pentadactyla]|nr:Centrosomal Protein Poc5 [Manis pentadactyla]